MGSRRGLTPFGMALYAYLTTNTCIKYTDVYIEFSEYFNKEIFLQVIEQMTEDGYITMSGFAPETELCLT